MQMELMKKCEFARDKISNILGLQLSCNEIVDLGVPLSSTEVYTPTVASATVEDVPQPSEIDDSIKKDQ